MAAPSNTCLGLQPSFMGHTDNRKLSGSVAESVAIVLNLSDDGTEESHEFNNETGNRHNKNRRISHFNIDQGGKLVVIKTRSID